MSLNKNIQSIITPQGQANNKMSKNINTAQRSHFLDIVRQFIQLANTCKGRPLKYLHQGYGFSLTKTPQSLVQLNKITTDCFDMDFKQLQKQLRQFGFEIKNKRLKRNDSLRTRYKFTEPFIIDRPIVIMLDDTFSEVSKLDQDQNIDDFPKEQQISQIMKLREEKERGPSKMFERMKAQSDGVLGTSQKKRQLEDASIEVKLYQQDLFSTPLASNRRLNSEKHHIPEQKNQLSVSLIERNNLYKENYQKCSKLIDNAMFQILTAHRKKKIGEKAEELLGKVIEIYDILSDNIENVNETVRQFQKKDAKMENSFSPTSKPLNGGNDYSK